MFNGKITSKGKPRKEKEKNENELSHCIIYFESFSEGLAISLKRFKITSYLVSSTDWLLSS
jgi:hypothetical protein